MSEPLLRFENVTKTYPGPRTGLLGVRGQAQTVLRGIDLEIKAGDRLAIVGESGCGKTTLARLLLDLTSSSGGRRYYRDVEYDTMAPSTRERFRTDCRMVFQNIGAMLNPLLRVREIIDEPMQVHTNWDAATRTRRTREVMRQVNADPAWLEVFPHRLSGGERRRVSLARALAVPPRLLVADEPVAGLDVVVQVEILELIDNAMRDNGGALVVISHDISVVRRLCREIKVLYAGRVMEEIPDRGDHLPRVAHPYSEALFGAARYLDTGGEARGALRAAEPMVGAPAEGCAYRIRCGLYEGHADRERCERHVPELVDKPAGGRVACHHWETQTRETTHDRR